MAACISTRLKPPYFLPSSSKRLTRCSARRKLSTMTECNSFSGIMVPCEDYYKSKPLSSSSIQKHTGKSMAIAVQPAKEPTIMKKKRRVVVTGLSVVSPVGHVVDVFYDNLLEGVSVSGITEIESFDCQQFPTEIGSALGGMKVFQDAIEALRVSYPFATTNMGSAMLAMYLGWMGPNYSISSACATSNYCILNAANHIIRGETDMMLSGGSDSAIIPIGLGGFVACNSLSQRNSDPTKASRPWDVNRDGFVMGEGAGVLLLKELEHAKARGAKIYAEFMGGGFTCDAYHMTEPHPDGKQVSNVMKVQNLVFLGTTSFKTQEPLLGFISKLLDNCGASRFREIGEHSPLHQIMEIVRSLPLGPIIANGLLLATPLEALAETCEAEQSIFNMNMPLLLLVALIGATVGGLLARQRKAELQRLNEQLRQINAALKRQAKIESYAPALSYAPAAARVPDNEVIVDPKKQELISHLKNGKNFLRNQNPDKAFFEFKAALELAQNIKDPIEEKKAARGLGASMQRQGKYKEAIKYHSMVLSISEREGEDSGNTEAFGAIADCYTELGDLEKAATFYDQYIARLQAD